MDTTFLFLPVSSPLHTGEPQDQLIAAFGAALSSRGGQRVDAEEVKEAQPLLFFVVTGGTERQILRFWQRRARKFRHEPALLIAHRTQNSLPAAMEVLARLQQDGASGRILLLDSPDDATGLDEVTRTALDAKAWYQLHAARIGLLGPPSDWLVASSPTPATVSEVWGPSVTAIPVSEIYTAMDQVDDAAASRFGASLKDNAIEVWEPTDQDITDAARAALALRAVVGRWSLTALALRCFELVLERKTTGCLALALLNEQGLVAGCEADLPSTLAMLWVRALLNQSSWMSNPAWIDVAHGSITLAHCTVARDLTTGYHMRSHFETGLGVALQGDIPPGKVTILRIGGKDLRGLWISEGETVPTDTGPSEELCRTQATIALDDGGAAEELLHRPLGNHVVLTKGHHASRLKKYWDTFICIHTHDHVHHLR